MPNEKPLIFVSCGQHTEAEKALGAAVCDLIRQARPDLQGYFAQDQSSVEGLSQNILRALHRSAAFICIMHRRGEVFRGSERVATRGSVWIEQEIAIVTFMNHVLDRRIPVHFYAQRGVCLEGIRTVLQLNPRVEFTDRSEVLDDLRTRLNQMIASPYIEYGLEPVVEYRTDNRRGDRHDYSLILTVRNTGVQRITDFRMEVDFPRRFLEPSIHSAVDARKSTTTHLCFVLDESRLHGKPLYSGQRLPEFTISYHVDDSLEESALDDEICVRLYSGNMPPVVRTYLMREFQNF